MPQSWNPNPAWYLGLELDDSFSYSDYPIGAVGRGVKWSALATGVLDEVRIRSSDAAGSGPLIAEISPNNATTVLVSTFQAEANELVAGATNITDEAGGAAALSDVTSTGDGRWIQSNANGGSFSLRFATASMPVGSKIIAVDFHIIAAGTFVFDIQPAGSSFNGPGQILEGDPSKFTEHIVRCGEVVYSSGFASGYTWWDRALVQAFDTTSQVSVRSVLSTSPTVLTTNWKIDRVYVVVHYETESRLAVGLAVPSNGWMTFPMQNPTKTGTWSRSLALYQLVIRRPTAWSHQQIWYSPQAVADSSVAWRFLRSPPPFFDFSAKAITPGGPDFFGLPIAVSDVSVLPSVRFRGSGVDLPESQPYSVVEESLAGTNSTAEASQSLQVPNATPRLAVLAWLTQDNPPLIDTGTDDLIVEVRNAFPDSTVRMTGSVRFSEIPYWAPKRIGPTGRVFRLVQIPLTPVGGFVPVTGTVYRVAFLPESTRRLWYTPVFNSDSSGDASQSFGGTAQWWSYVTAGDAPVLWASIGTTTPISGLTATVFNQTIGHEDNSVCLPRSLDYVRIRWSGTFAQTAAIERYTEYDGWELIARVTPPVSAGTGPHQIFDYEPRIGVPTKYRVYNVAAPGTGTEVQTIPAETGFVTLEGHGNELLFVSNHLPAANVGYVDTYSGGLSERDYVFSESEETVVRTAMGRDYAIAAHSGLRRGTSFTRTIQLATNRNVGLPSLGRALDPLRLIALADLPYVCVKDTEGNRWHAVITVPDGRTLVAANRYLASVGVTEIAEHPTPITSL